MLLTTKPIGSLYTTRNESGIGELSFADSGLRVVVDTNQNGGNESLWVEYYFDAPRGFLFLDEGDLIRYWEVKNRDRFIYPFGRVSFLEKVEEIVGSELKSTHPAGRKNLRKMRSSL